MAKKVVPLTDARCKHAKFDPAGGNKLFDGGGLYLIIQTNGLKKWRMKYRQANGKENTLSFGGYPETPLAKAREQLAAARALLADGVDPAIQRTLDRQEAMRSSDDSFEAIATEWLATREAGWSKGYFSRMRNALKANVYPHVGRLPITKITGKVVLEVAQRIEKREAHEMATRVLDCVGMVFRYAAGTGRPVTDVTHGLDDFLHERPPVKHYPHVTVDGLPELLRRIDVYHGRPETRFALKIMMRTFPRTNELRWAEWSEFSFSDAEWRIPSERMKGRLAAKKSGVAHLIPLSRQVIAMLKELHDLTGRHRLLFPGIRDPANTPMSAETMNKALKIMGFEGEQTGHGFRGLASTIMNEYSGVRDKAIEKQLAHKERNKVRSAYDHAEYMAERRFLMQWWSEYLEAQMALGAKEISIPPKLFVVPPNMPPKVA